MKLTKILLAVFCVGLVVVLVMARRSNTQEIVRGDIGGKLDEHMKMLASGGFSGVVLFTRSGETLLSKGYGEANQAKRLPYSVNTVFDIGSLTKQFTGAAILKLETQGKLRVTDRLKQYLAGAPPDKADITLHHLLTHSAGFAPGLGDDYEAINRDEYTKLALSSKLRFTPGERFSYSNAGYSLLGIIIELVTGQPYEHYLHDQLFKPAGMSKTGYRIPKWNPNELATGYSKDGSAWGTPLDKLWAADGPYWHLRANGGILSTVGDMYKWHLALAGEQVLSRTAKEKYFAPHIAMQPQGKSFYGYGWAIEKSPIGANVIAHNGSNGIFYATFFHDVDEKMVLIMASNKASHSVRGEIDKLRQLIYASLRRSH